MTVEKEGSAVGNAIVTRTENGGGPGPVKGAVTLGPGSEIGRENEGLWWEKMVGVVADVENETENVGGQEEEIAGVEKEVETGRKGVGAGIGRETGREAKV